MEGLPSELLLKIFGHIETQHIGKIAQVCRRWKHMIYCKYLWKNRVCIPTVRSDEDVLEEFIQANRGRIFHLDLRNFTRFCGNSKRFIGLINSISELKHLYIYKDLDLTDIKSLDSITITDFNFDIHIPNYLKNRIKEYKIDEDQVKHLWRDQQMPVRNCPDKIVIRCSVHYSVRCQALHHPQIKWLAEHCAIEVEEI